MKQLSLERLASKSNAVVGWSVLSHPTRLHEIGGFSVGTPTPELQYPLAPMLTSF